MVINIYTDGACSGNQNENNVGGWGTILEAGDNKKELYGGSSNTTNNIMELTAVLEGLKALKSLNHQINVYSDSAYIVNCFNQNGMSNGKQTDGRPLKKSLWKTRNFGSKLSTMSTRQIPLIFTRLRDILI